MVALSTSQRPRDGDRRSLRRHFIEMIAVMFVGMAVLGAVVSGVFALLGCSSLLHHVSVRGPIMATNMAIAMVAWMRWRGHSWAACSDMAIAMYVPLVILLVPFWLELLPDGAVLGPMHLLMLPAMWIAIRHRRDEYTGHRHRLHRATT
jgi:hypothetical protein